MLTERAAALFNTLERQAQLGLDEIADLRQRIGALEAENARLRDALARQDASPERTPAPRTAAERGYPLPRRAPPEMPVEPTEDVASVDAVSPGTDVTADAAEPGRPLDGKSLDEERQSRLAIDEAPSPQALLDEWYRRYTDTFFKGHTRPLKVGIHEDLVSREPWPDKLVRRALACYVHLPRYLKAVRAGAERVDLDGQPAGTVSEGEARHAHKKLETLQARQRESDKGRERKPEAGKGARLDRKLSELLAKHGRH